MKPLDEIAAHYPGCHVPDMDPTIILRTFGTMERGTVAFCPRRGFALEIVNSYGGGAVCRICGTGSRVYYNAFANTLDYGSIGNPSVEKAHIYEVVFMGEIAAESYCTTPQSKLPEAAL
jgi:hypothetical protein